MIFISLDNIFTMDSEYKIENSPENDKQIPNLSHPYNCIKQGIDENSFFFNEEETSLSQFLHKYFYYLQENNIISEQIQSPESLEELLCIAASTPNSQHVLTYIQFITLLCIQVPTTLNLYKTDKEALKEISNILKRFPILISSEILLDISLQILDTFNDSELIWTFFSTVELLPPYVELIADFFLQKEDLYTNHRFLKIISHLTKEVHTRDFSKLQIIIEEIYSLFQQGKQNKYFVQVIIQTFSENQNIFDIQSYFLSSSVFTSDDYILLSFFIFSHYFSFESLEDLFTACVEKNDETFHSKRLASIILIHKIKEIPVEELEMEVLNKDHEDNLFSQIIECIYELDCVDKDDLEQYLKQSENLTDWLIENKPNIEWNFFKDNIQL